MNKKRVDQLLPRAYEVLSSVQIAQNGKVDPKFQNQISSFASAVKNGSLISAIAFFGQQKKAAVNRTKLIEAIGLLMSGENAPANAKDALFNMAKRQLTSKQQAELKEKVEDCAIALKLAMNLYDMPKDQKDSSTSDHNTAQPE